MSAQEIQEAEAKRIRLAPTTKWTVDAVNAFSEASAAERTIFRVPRAEPAAAREILDKVIALQGMYDCYRTIIYMVCQRPTSMKLLESRVATGRPGSAGAGPGLAGPGRSTKHQSQSAKPSAC